MELVVLILFIFVGTYVLLSSAAWVTGGLIFFFDRERKLSDDFYDLDPEDLPSVTVIVPAYEEEELVGACLDALRDLDYPDLEVIAVDDGSRDETLEAIRSRLPGDPRLRLVVSESNEGKAMAMNDALVVARGEIIVVVDADTRLHREALLFMVAHFVRVSAVGGVTGNPRPINRENLLTELQVVEYASQISLMRRAQVIWGRLMTMSGVISAFRRSALADVGVFDPSMSTEDIELSWRLQVSAYDIHYEPRAVIGMNVPETLGTLRRQRFRWARGLIEVLGLYLGTLRHWGDRRQWPVFGEVVLSLVWWHALLLLAALLVLGLVIPGFIGEQLTYFPWGWTAVIMLAALVQFGVGLLLDRRYDRSALSAIWILPWFPLVYWVLVGLPSALVSIPVLFRPQKHRNVLWQTNRPS